MSYQQCPLANEVCPYWEKPPPPSLASLQEHGCRSDYNHLVPQRLAIDGLTRLYIYSPENGEQICRVEHEAKTRAGDEPLPERDIMLASVRRQIKDGSLHVSRQIKRKVMKGKI